MSLYSFIESPKVVIKDKICRIGAVLEVAKGYATSTIYRYIWDDKTKVYQLRALWDESQTRYVHVLGYRTVIMEDYKYHPATRPGAYNDEYKPASATGKRECVLLVATDMRSKPFYVRKSDILRVISTNSVNTVICVKLEENKSLN